MNFKWPSRAQKQLYMKNILRKYYATRAYIRVICCSFFTEMNNRRAPCTVETAGVEGHCTFFDWGKRSTGNLFKRVFYRYTTAGNTLIAAINPDAVPLRLLGAFLLWVNITSERIKLQARHSGQDSKVLHWMSSLPQPMPHNPIVSPQTSPGFVSERHTATQTRRFLVAHPASHSVPRVT